MAYIRKIIVTIGGDIIELLKSRKFDIKKKAVTSPCNGNEISVVAFSWTIILKTYLVGKSALYLVTSSEYIYIASCFSEEVTGQCILVQNVEITSLNKHPLTLKRNQKKQCILFCRKEVCGDDDYPSYFLECGRRIKQIF